MIRWRRRCWEHSPFRNSAILTCRRVGWRFGRRKRCGSGYCGTVAGKVEVLDMLAFHPASAIFDLLNGQDFDALVNDITKNGLINEIWVHPDGSILDGRNRYRACLAAGVEPR